MALLTAQVMHEMALVSLQLVPSPPCPKLTGRTELGLPWEGLDSCLSYPHGKGGLWIVREFYLSRCFFSVVLMKSHLCPGHKNILKESVDPSFAWTGPLSPKAAVRLYTRCQQIFSIKGKIVNILGFAHHRVSVLTTQLCHYSTKADIGNA